ncbi:2Fe-2S iron-sulfur cluster-binding protein [Salinispirillum sp. LH 10-3-1]|uniref:2Fe-2S iron-sulfur cluster-binding protein n=1 Tax=Salinispirillum sp. LH 10-3-1 TaxID=2952525 RepID=A0AB38YDS9_9GAMM
MFAFLAKKRAVVATINGVVVMSNTKETVLEAALREGIRFPHRCRVGGCATCKCQLIEGKIKALTDTSYVLSGEELDSGYILACQSLPLTDIEIAVAMPSRSKR